MTPWYTFWTRSAQIATGSPEVIAHRLTLMSQPWPWPAATVVESQRMVTEKMLAASEMWWAGCMAMWTGGVASARPGASWHATRTTNQMVRAANKAMRPYSVAVNANVKRLRQQR